ncbi:complex I subunit 5 family protein [Halochromatium glycolicum]|uniref:NADH:quinone oxidoreductase/Mrp antiporter transmembrane domain-containing protein n=1 Tax=Halochromatium glycolicum TaxID=85075 RepID=A0AAJ0U2B0_9GAMM|nr:complex I subunit 5 family protein [Halochromatium glycolicum]MBK1703555.1 hypothetical protein [Halochromatium glycolicum]
MTELSLAPFSLAPLPLAPLLIATLLWPLLLGLRTLLQALIAPVRPRLSPVWLLDWLWISAPWPALALAVLGADGSLRLDAWLLGGHWELDAQRRLLLAFTALLWGLAGGYARGYLAAEQAWAAAGDRDARGRLLRFALFWLLTLCGNLLLLLAEDIASFYLGFALMTFAAYPLVIHSGRREARIGGLAYLVLAVLGEGMILAGLLWGAGTGSALTLSQLRATLATAEMGLWMGLLLWLGFGVKAGVIGLHLWLPLAHPVAPTPASAVLSGAMIKAGLVGWLSTLPLGMSAVDGRFEGLGLVMLAAGLIGAFAAALLGVAQRQPKAVLAYSSVSQMGLIAVLVALGLLQPSHWPALSALALFFAAHHGLSKGALFLGVGISEQAPRWPAWLLWTLLTLPALSLAGALGSGLITKWGAKTLLEAANEKTLAFWLSLAAVGTTLLMARTLWLQWKRWRETGKMGLTSSREPRASQRPIASSEPNPAARASDALNMSAFKPPHASLKLQTDLSSSISQSQSQSQNWNQNRSHRLALTGADDQRLLAPMPLAWLLTMIAALSLPCWGGWLTGDFPAGLTDGLPLDLADEADDKLGDDLSDGLEDGLVSEPPSEASAGLSGGLSGDLEGMHSGQCASGFAWPPLSALPALLWPVGLGLLLAVIFGWGLRRFAPRLSSWLPAGDLWWPLTACSHWLWRLGRRLLRWLGAGQAAWITWWNARERDGLRGLDTLIGAEDWLRRQLPLLLMAVALGLAAALLLSAAHRPPWP